LAASVGVEQRRVLLVPDRADHRRPARRHRPDQGLVGEREQVLERAAAPRDHDHVDLGVGIEAVQRVDDLAGRVRPLHRYLLDPEPDGRPAPPGVLLDVPLRRGITPADESDDTRQEGDRPFPFG
jgi:hypothetical protein